MGRNLFAQEQTKGRNLFVKQAITDFDLDSMQEIGDAPELNQLSVPAFKASLGLLTTGDSKSLQGILSSQFGGDVSFNETPEGTVVNFPSGSYALNKPGLSGQDIAKFASDVLSFTPAGRLATIPKVAGASALTEAGIQATEQGLGGESAEAEDVIVSGLLGGFFKGAEDLIGAGYRAFKGSPRSDIVKEASESGIPVMTSDVMPPSTFAGKSAQQISEKIPVVGTGAARESQQEMRTQAVANIADKYGQFSYESIIKSLKTRKDKIKSAAGNVLESSGNKLDSIGEIPTENTSTAIVEAIKSLSKPGVIKSGGAIDDINTLIKAMDEAPQTFTTLKENRTAFRDIVNGFDKAEKSQLGSRSKKLLKDVELGITKDMESFAKSNLEPSEFNKWKRANAVYADEAKKLTKTRLKSVLDKGDITPESVSSMLFGQKPSELNLLYNSLGQSGRKNARAAIVSKIVDNTTKRAGGMTPNSFATEMKKFNPQINAFFKGKDKAQLKGLQKALEATRRAQDSSVATATGQQLIPIATGAAAVTDLGLTSLVAGTAGGLSRLYESAPVRNALLRLSSAPKGSTKFEKALSEFRIALSSASQSGQRE